MVCVASCYTLPSTPPLAPRQALHNPAEACCTVVCHASPPAPHFSTKSLTEPCRAHAVQPVVLGPVIDITRLPRYGVLAPNLPRQPRVAGKTVVFDQAAGVFTANRGCLREALENKSGEGEGKGPGKGRVRSGSGRKPQLFDPLNMWILHASGLGWGGCGIRHQAITVVEKAAVVNKKTAAALAASLQHSVWED